MNDANIALLINEARNLLDRLDRIRNVDLSVDEHDYIVYHIENVIDSLESAIQY